jgi:hypothetical protein
MRWYPTRRATRGRPDESDGGLEHEFTAPGLCPTCLERALAQLVELIGGWRLWPRVRVDPRGSGCVLSAARIRPTLDEPLDEPLGRAESGGRHMRPPLRYLVAGQRYKSTSISLEPGMFRRCGLAEPRRPTRLVHTLFVSTRSWPTRSRPPTILQHKKDSPRFTTTQNTAWGEGTKLSSPPPSCGWQHAMCKLCSGY